MDVLLSMLQREAYNRVPNGGLRRWLIHGGKEGAEVFKEERRTGPLITRARTSAASMRPPNQRNVVRNDSVPKWRSLEPTDGCAGAR
ncbi:uncharacterized protein LACBIDRAFT_318568 [Laccaria bicolor S238N-H82]|uniref:Predicted protein n=1 Tax=Laccaria bicolor (strain S238N-H82 / ATCC MYA-4686) TaxID=486041 RepID=B0E2P1_LACBS|nr:uncharacterized protein LACBIDRAFT_318568 [Laccaria bicolor S238N-H82]EDQ98886.1 predicted protein [Laccaria bicolor S238N-H82]|eukprot:XP_001890465.1 predicted protein [Laccaria bicolor S238N-H82]